MIRWVEKYKVILIGWCLLNTIASCNLMPGSFWKILYKDDIVHHISDQGPWGGHREIFWRAENSTRFSKEKVIAFAETNGWKFVDSITRFSSHSKKWYVSDKEVTAPFQNAYFDKWVRRDMNLLRIDSKWIIESEAGSGEFVTAYAYVLFSDDSNEMIFLHVWGE